MSWDESLKATSAIVAVAGSLVALVVSGLNMLNFYADRDAKGRQDDYQNQLGIVRIYFEKIADDFCKKKNEAVLLVQVAHYSASKLKSGPVEDNPVAGLADVMKRDFDGRRCPADATVVQGPPDASGVVSVDVRQAGSTYAAKETVAQTASRSPANQPGTYTIYIQYRQDVGAAQRIQADIDADPLYAVPGIERVAAAPGQNEIRIYKDTAADRDAAQSLKTRFLPDARIVSLAKAYPNLRAGTMEVWLKD